jgi:two-component system response regulator DesR
VFLSEGTVRNKVSEILAKLGARDRAEAIRVAQDNCWL